ncbi:MAG: MBL fold metallo-hydrolase [Armatimonadetes bacterium]|nr:MBL fold metallo-hydrolase [Armatimonadota bacterium]
MLNIKWFGHSMWKIWNNEITIITDPFTDIGYKMPENETADILLSSHDHFDHNNYSMIKGNPELVKSAGNFNFKGMHITMIPTWHDETKGSERGDNLLMKFVISGKTILHCGDLGHIPSDEIFNKLGNIDILFIPVGGFFTIDAETAKTIAEKINPYIVFPIHYKTDAIDFTIAGKDAYLNLIDDLRKVDSNEIILKENDFDKKQTIILNYE